MSARRRRTVAGIPGSFERRRGRECGDSTDKNTSEGDEAMRKNTYGLIGCALTVAMAACERDAQNSANADDANTATVVANNGSGANSGSGAYGGGSGSQGSGSQGTGSTGTGGSGSGGSGSGGSGS